MSLPPFHWWRSVFFLAPTLSLITIAFGTLSLILTRVDRTGVLPHRYAQVWARLILWTSGVRLERRGRPLPAEDESCIFVANHASFFDIPILFAGVPRQLRIMAKASLRHVPFVGWHLKRAGHLLVNRENPGAGILKRMQRLLGEHRSLILFPEGGRSPDGRLEPFKAGVFLLAIENRLPIVPISVDGSRTVMPVGRLRVDPATVILTIHDPIPTDHLRRRDARELAERVRTVIGSAIPGSLA